MGDDIAPPELAESIVNTCRVTLGDSLRSVVFFTPDDEELLYLRSDLYEGDEERAQAVKQAFVENERLGFTSRETYKELAKEPLAEPDIGLYEFTIRVFADGFVSRVIVEDYGVLVTTDGLEMNSFEEMEVAIRKMLEAALE